MTKEGNMSQIPNTPDLSSLYDEFNLEQAIDSKFSTEGVNTENGSWVPDTPTQTTKLPARKTVPDTRSAEQRIDDLFEKMGSQHRLLLGVMGACEERKPFEEVEETVTELQQFNASVYSPANFCGMLEAAGALAHVTEDGTPYDEFVNEPELVTIGDQEFLKPRPAPKSFWETTPAGAARVDAYDPHAQLASIYGEFPQTLPIFKRVLAFLANEPEGASLAKISAIVDGDPLVQKPRFYAGHFLERLERADAVEWRDTWYITDIGRESLEQMADVVDPGLPAAQQ